MYACPLQPCTTHSRVRWSYMRSTDSPLAQATQYQISAEFLSGLLAVCVVSSNFVRITSLTTFSGSSANPQRRSQPTACAELSPYSDSPSTRINPSPLSVSAPFWDFFYVLFNTSHISRDHKILVEPKPARVSNLINVIDTVLESGDLISFPH